VAVVKKLFLLHNKVVLRLFIATLFLLFLLLALLRLPSSQAFIVDRAVKYVYSHYGVHADIQKLYLSYWGDLEAEGIVVYDDLNDTLFSIDGVSADMSFYNIYSNRLLLDKLYLKNPYFNLYLDTAEVSNLMRFVYSLKEYTDTVETTDFSLLFVKIYDLQIDGGRFLFDCNALPDSSSFHFIGPTIVKDLILRAQDVEYANARVDFVIDTLMLLDENRLDSISLFGHGFVSNGTIDLPRLLLKTSRSSFDIDNFLMTAPTFPDYVDYLNTVLIRSDVNFASVALADIEGFVPFFENSSDIVTVSGYVNGTVNRIDSKNIYLSLSDSTRYHGDISIIDVTSPYDSKWRLFAKHFDVYATDLQTSHLVGQGRFPKFDSVLSTFPLSYLHYTGAITGYPSDCRIEGVANSQLGEINVDLHSNIDTAERLKVDAVLYMNGVDIGKLQGIDKDCGALTGTVDLDFSIQGKKLERGMLDADISSFEYNGYLYNDLFADVSYSRTGIIYSVYCDDPNLNLDIAGQANEAGVEWNLTGAGRVGRLNFSNLGFFDKGRKLNSSFYCKFRLHRNRKKDFGFNALFENVRVTSVNAEMFEDATAVQFLQNDDSHFFSLQSEYFNAELRGDFTTAGVQQAVRKVFANVLPSVVSFDSSQNSDPVDVRIHAFSDSLSPLFAVFYSDSISGGSGFEFVCNLKSNNSSASLQAKLPNIAYGKREISNIAVNAVLQGKNAEGIVRMDIPFERRSFPNTDLVFVARNDSVFSKLEWNSTDTIDYKGEISGTTVFFRDSLNDSLQFYTSVEPAELFIDGTGYHLDSCAIYGAESRYRIKNLKLGNKEQELLAFGSLTKNLSDTLFVIADNVDVGDFNSLLGDLNMNVEGMLSGGLTIAGSQTDMIIETNASITNCVFNTVEFGTVDIASNWQKERKSLDFSARARKNGTQFFELTGDYIPRKKYLAIDAKIDSLDISFIEPFLEGQLSVEQGWVSGSGQIFGELSALETNGVFHAKSVVAKSDYLNTVYKARGDLHLEGDRLVFDRVRINDLYGGSGQMTGYFSLLKIPELDFDFLFKFENAKSLHTSSSDNELYYGDVSASGTARLFDKDGELFIVVSAAFEDGSQLFIPISNVDDIENGNLLRFTSDTVAKENNIAVADDYINMDLDLRLTPQNEIQIIMDEQAGDIIKAKGSGNVLVSINDNSDVLFMGEYNISEGEYLFTLMNLLNKRFTLLPSSTIFFSGKLDDAEVDIKAVYRTKASLKPLLGQDSTIVSKRTKVECLLSLTGNLYNPDVRFDISLPDDYQGNAKDRLESLTEDERNQQFLSLLVLNRFMEIDSENAPENGYATAGDASVNSMEVLSNQFSNWLSSISDEFDFGVNYRPGDQVVSDELEVGVSTQILNDRISIDYNRAESFGDEQADEQKPDGYFGDVTVEMKLTKNGKLRLRGFTRDAEDDPLVDNAATTNGVGISFTDEFNSFRDLFGRSGKQKDGEKPDDKATKQKARDALKPEEQGLNETK